MIPGVKCEINGHLLDCWVDGLRLSVGSEGVHLVDDVEYCVELGLVS